MFVQPFLAGNIHKRVNSSHCFLSSGVYIWDGKYLYGFFICACEVFLKLKDQVVNSRLTSALQLSSTRYGEEKML